MQKSARLAFSLFMFLVGSFLLTYSYIWGADMSVGERFGPMFYPRIILWIWVLLAAGLTVEYCISHSGALPALNKRSLFASILSVSVCCLVFDALGFLATCVLFCCAYPLLLGYKRVAVAVVSAVLFSVVTWYVFNNMLLIVLPEGIAG